MRLTKTLKSILPVAAALFAGSVLHAAPIVEFNPSDPSLLYPGDDPNNPNPAFLVTLGTDTGEPDGNPGIIGWSFTTHSAITVTALDVFDPSAGGGLVQIYDGDLNILASATLTTGDGFSGSPLAFYSQAITPITLAADTTYYIAQTAVATTQVFAATGTLTVDPLISYLGGISAYAPTLPTADMFQGGNDPSYFGPDFEGTEATPEPSSVVLFASGTMLFVGFGYFRRRRA